MNKYLLGIDIGTSACKVAVFSKEGKVIDSAARDYPVYYPREGWAEQNPDEWWESVCSAIKEIIGRKKIKAMEIAGIGVDGQSWSAIPIDSSGKVLYNTPIWMDTRAADICEEVKRVVSEEEIFEVCGNPFKPSYSTPKILWYKKNIPNIYKKIDKILQSNSFIVYRLTEVFSQDMSQGYGLHCFDMRTGQWNEEMSNRLGIPMSFLPPIYQCHEVVGRVTQKAALETGLEIGIPVVAGGLDACCGTLGAGVLHPGETQEQGGQAGGMSICIDEYHADIRLILSYHVVPDKWLLQGGTTGGGGVMRWLHREFGAYEDSLKDTKGKNALEQFNDLAEGVSPGSDGLIFLPYMAGERSPIWNPKAKGVYYGLDFSKTKGHMIRSAMEGVAYALKHNLEVAKEAGGEVEILKAIGGSANSKLWTQIKADVTGKRIVVPYSDAATTLGACILAGVGVGLYDSFEEAVGLTVKETRVHEPDRVLYELYETNYKKYRDIYECLKPIMNEAGGV
ncbi:MAG: xylulokinase [Suipraeoptans sp.]